MQDQPHHGDAPSPGRSRRDAALFLWKWVQAPTRIGSVWPSGRSLGRAMAAQLDLSVPGAIVELGAGTGPITATLLQSGVPPERFLALERDPAMAAVLRQRFPAIRVIEGDAGELPALMQAEGVETLSAIVSCLPLVSLPRSLVRRVVEGGFEILHPDGRFIQFTYGVVSPIPLRHFAVQGRRVCRVWRNVPPAAVWRYTRVPGVAVARDRG
ncbi:phosphatidylethanolamine/phosphatidyl-N-methylethanolamine N-methyltransferase [Stella humosa]|uniref:Phosphatidylethanolamine/phosphatidyl-N-methylethanolamine N-methyltransferase n=1 Tax=Stella humosa TaxID=94 RepID=A0A3N1LD89_9PROT|nr:methyltransferase domain-containing protein [Stella humosa]ROP91031.1 phosphatidylethanolamine/phosphatidyl-N-methylethanolamine N-methyltransferase [Stella humosa]BBK34619.1 methyltransferase [Stella humosa]